MSLDTLVAEEPQIDYGRGRNLVLGDTYEVVLFHGTSSVLMEEILKTGLVPDFRVDGNEIVRPADFFRFGDVGTAYSSGFQVVRRLGGQVIFVEAILERAQLIPGEKSVRVDYTDCFYPRPVSRKNIKAVYSTAPSGYSQASLGVFSC